MRYGNTAPRTALGKVLTMFYAVIGVPLMLLWLSNIGTLMANTFKFAYIHICCPKKSARSRSVQKRSPSLKQEPSSIQVKYSVSAMTCETHVVQQQQQHHQQQQHQQLHHIQQADPSNFHCMEKQPRAVMRREQRATLKTLDPAAKQMLRECAEYNVNMSQDERSRMVLHQLHAAESNMGTMAGIEEELSDDGEGMVDVTSSIILPPPVNMDGMEMEDYGCRQGLSGMSSGLGVSVGGSVNDGSMGRTGGGSGSQISQVEGTPSRVPLLHRGVDGVRMWWMWKR
ncbi:Potassium channel subfamily K member 18 [Orchesella cincta]|uniref:Potassium channel subfamily K member 18 n=1 Tax=Orchesella cincta TaxID=48709 RepID=A0A1D2MSZ8_ORCCI|nr:Potassium channel subfamily K member 18 [Orchesella cincta]